jgi:cytochrome P450
MPSSTRSTVRATNCETRLSTSTIPVVLKPGMLVYLSLMHLHTSPKYWGADAKEFVPERFLGNNKEAVRNPAFMPFSSGPRSCVSLK